MSPATAKAAGLTTVPLGSYYTTHQPPSSEQKQKLDAAVANSGISVDLHVEEGYVSEYGIVLLALTVFAGLSHPGRGGIATGLAQADAEADLRTLAAVGAPDRVRRTLSGFQCGVVAAMGVLLGSAAGVLPAIGLRLTERREAMAWYEEGSTPDGWAPHPCRPCRSSSPGPRAGCPARRRTARRGAAGRTAHPVTGSGGPPRGGVSGRPQRLRRTSAGGAARASSGTAAAAAAGARAAEPDPEPLSGKRGVTASGTREQAAA